MCPSFMSRRDFFRKSAATLFAAASTSRVINAQTFKTHQINELIVSRPHLSLKGRRDPLTPPAGVERIRDHLMPLYQKYGKAEDCHIELFDCGHEETPAMRRLVLEWMDKHLVNGVGGSG